MFQFFIIWFLISYIYGCEDLTTSCKNYERRKDFYCKHEWTKLNCPKMCGICTAVPRSTFAPITSLTTSAPVCKDLSDVCEYYSRMGHCDKKHYNYIWSTVNCRKTCKICKASATVAPNHSTKPPRPKTNIPQTNCGISGAKGRVIGGVKSKEGQWPWQIALYRSGLFNCGGALISPEWIVTAAHCVYGHALSSLQVVVGDTDLAKKSGTEQYFNVEYTKYHPFYGQGSTFNNDIALIKLKAPAIMRKGVSTVCLPNANEDLDIGAECYVSGWGKMQHPGNSVTDLQHASLKIIDPTICSQRNNKWAPVTDKMICAANSYPNIQASCHGDSGGPFVCQQKDGRWMLFGAVSWGSPRCYVPDAYSVFSKVSHFRNWIDDTVRNYAYKSA